MLFREMLCYLLLAASEASHARAGVVLYTGRWAVGHMNLYVENHLQQLIRPHHLDVIVHGFQEQLCACDGQEAFVQDVQKQFGSLLTEVQYHNRSRHHFPIHYAGADPHILSPFKHGQARQWFEQFTHVRQAFATAVAVGYEFVVRARIDGLINGFVLPPMPLPANSVFAIRNVPGGHFAPVWSDWMYVAMVPVFMAVVDTHLAFLNETVRCYGTCPEEQVEMHVTTSGSVMHQLHANITLAQDRKEWCKGPKREPMQQQQ